MSLDAATRERLARKFWAQVARTDRCWSWLGHIQNEGYGMLNAAGHSIRAHRFAYELLVGPIPEGLVLDHLCRNRACVNPAHLEPVTDAENVMRGEGVCARNARKTQCHKGHEYTPENTYITARGWRECRRCRLARQNAYLKRRAA